MNFYTIVLIIAIVLLILLLTLLGMMMNRGTTNSYPQYSNKCPDGWGTDNSGNCLSTGSINVPAIYEINQNYATNSPGYINWFYKSGSFLNGVTGTSPQTLSINTSVISRVCDKKTWANANGIQWDGITNSNASC